MKFLLISFLSTTMICNYAVSSESSEEYKGRPPASPVHPSKSLEGNLRRSKEEKMKTTTIPSVEENYLLKGHRLDSIDAKTAATLRNSVGESDLLDALEKEIYHKAWEKKDLEAATMALYVGTLIATSTDVIFYNLLTGLDIYEEKPSKETIQKALSQKWNKFHH